MTKKTAMFPLFQLEPACITMFQGAILYFTFIISTVDIFVPSITAAVAGRDSWISAIVSVILAVPVAFTIIALALRFPRRSFIEYSQMVLGAWGGRLVGLLYLFLILVIGATTAREFEEIMGIAFFTHTPPVVFGIVVVGLSAYLVRSGLEVICRVNGILLPVGLFLLLFVAGAVLPEVDMKHYLPFLEHGYGSPARGAIILMAYLLEGFILIYILPLIRQPHKVFKAFTFTLPLLGLALLTGTVSIPVFGLEATSRLLMPAIELAREIQIPGLPRSDILIMLGWYAGILVRIAVAHYLLTLLTAQWAGLRSYKPLILPFGVIIVALSRLMFSNIGEVTKFIGNSFVYTLLCFEFVIPLFLLVISWLRGIEEKGTA
ncbi:MAG TPA: endospore germination permease [Bacillota bacterium]|jgi:spore germination protein KB|nr:endospore germination permease [Peptococcaceae bacterium MAG4]NLW37430.1 endospore germination permease [Peptococcaceae bacterium]HPU35244.1 endospore germination permease [Bacillota bacterium]HPZ43464.1 endospore germination permease [Bacillota bacterium]HQD76876.1 endospore germination permease [Bacillota bacterium]